MNIPELNKKVAEMKETQVDITLSPEEIEYIRSHEDEHEDYPWIMFPFGPLTVPTACFYSGPEDGNAYPSILSGK